MICNRFFLFCLVLLAWFPVRAQFDQDSQYQIDSINTLLKDPATHDTAIMNAKLQLAFLYGNHNLDTLVHFCNEIVQMYEDSKDKETDDAVRKALILNTGSAWSQLAYSELIMGNIPKALEYYETAQSYFSEINDHIGTFHYMVSVGYIHKSQGDNQSAMEFYLDAERLMNEHQLDVVPDNIYSNIGVIYAANNDHTNALTYYKKHYSEALKIKDGLSQARALINMSSAYFSLGDTLHALQSCKEGLELSLKYKNDYWVSVAYGSLFKIDSSNPNKLEHLNKAYEYANKSGSPRLISENTHNLYQEYKKQSKYEQALQMYETHVLMRDSIKNEETQKATIRQQTKYEFEKEQLLKEQEAQEQARIEAEAVSRRDNLQYSLIFLGIILFFAIVLSLGFIKVSPAVAEGLIFFAFLILFEFLLVLSDPFVESITGGEPIYKLLANAVLAGAIFPAHAFFENLLKRRIVK